MFTVISSRKSRKRWMRFSEFCRRRKIYLNCTRSGVNLNGRSTKPIREEKGIPSAMGEQGLSACAEHDYSASFADAIPC